MKRIYNCLGMAQFGSVLEWGSRGRRFKSSYPDHSGVNFIVYSGFFIQIVFFFFTLVSSDLLIF